MILSGWSLVFLVLLTVESMFLGCAILMDAPRKAVACFVVAEILFYIGFAVNL